MLQLSAPVLIKVEFIRIASYPNIKIELLGVQCLEHALDNDFEWWDVMEENVDWRKELSCMIHHK